MSPATGEGLQSLIATYTSGPSLPRIVLSERSEIRSTKTLVLTFSVALPAHSHDLDCYSRTNINRFPHLEEHFSPHGNPTPEGHRCPDTVRQEVPKSPTVS